MSKRIKILFVSFGTKIAPATRYRVYQMLPFLKNYGFDYYVYSIISEKMTLRTINSPNYNKSRKLSHYTHIMIERFIRSWKAVYLAGKFDIIFLQRATFLFKMDWLLRARNPNIIFDIDDSIYMSDKKESGLIGWVKNYVKRKETVSVLKISKYVIVENNHIKKFAQNYCDSVSIITGPVDIQRNFPKSQGSDMPKEITIGWIGSPSTSVYLKIFASALKELSGRWPIKLRLIGVDSYDIDGVKTEMVKWGEATEIAELHKFDIGIMPMPDNEWTRGKVGCKMLQYMVNAIPVVVSYTPTNAEVIENGVNGILVKDHHSCVEAIEALIKDPALARKIGIAGRKTVEERYSLEAALPKFINIFKRCIA